MRDDATRLKSRLQDESGFGLVETLIALTILVIGLVAVSGLSLASADQARIAKWRSEQAAAAQIVLEDVQGDGFSAAASGTDTVSIAGHEYTVAITVSDISSRVKQVAVVVAGVGDVGARSYTARLYKPKPLPDPVPASP
ncbi:MAG: prepilin-type N-terminal cleavage/methylation domain-containing protein [Candidatus Palauibacterales bacterium]|jgi:Tfp pilus assembly protein PilV|nr:prepilin-type N-terminal cleavage/methylation domain-containing protein [Candidatus Palauibacterales bacterium]MDP2484013.1 prepilin-type N-terminal cleavage/methylation domain-containing protein [Candidatus Palauibacterales bacterium]